MTSNHLSIFSKLPDVVKYNILSYVIYTPSSIALKTYLGWYSHFLKYNKEKENMTFKIYFFSKLKRIERDLLIRLINYKLVKKQNTYK